MFLEQELYIYGSANIISILQNYFKQFANLKEENVKNANLELFAPGMTVEEQIELMIEKARQEAQGAKIFLKFIDPVFYDTYPGTSILIEPAVDEVIKSIGSFVVENRRTLTRYISH